MRTVYKYPIAGYLGTLTLPDGAKIVHIGDDPQGQFCAWAEVDNQARGVDRPFRVVGTGQPVPDGYEYTGTVMEGGFVWHLYVSP